MPKFALAADNRPIDDEVDFAASSDPSSLEGVLGMASDECALG